MPFRGVLPNTTPATINSKQQMFSVVRTLPLFAYRTSQELNDNFKGDEGDWPDEDVKRAQFRRACLVISGAEGIGLAPLIRPRHINNKAQLYNIAFVAQLLNRRPRIHRESLHLDASVAMQVGWKCCCLVLAVAMVLVLAVAMVLVLAVVAKVHERRAQQEPTHSPGKFAP